MDAIELLRGTLELMGYRDVRLLRDDEADIVVLADSSCVDGCYTPLAIRGRSYVDVERAFIVYARNVELRGAL